MKINVIGLGYIGLPTAITFAHYGVEVVGVDISEVVVDSLQRGQAPIEEPEIETYLAKALENQKFKAQLVPEKADAFIIAVPTPNKEDQYGSCDLMYLKAAMQAVLPYVEKGNTVIVESTIQPRTMEDLVAPFFEAEGFVIGQDLYLLHCPERVLPGKIFEELVRNNRIIGGMTAACIEQGKKIYQTFVQGEMLGTSTGIAELSKLMENTYRDVNIALANELVQIGDRLNIDALEVIRLANQHPRVNIHQPGPGVGGHCLAVDPYFVVAAAPEEAKLIQLGREINANMPEFIIKKIKEIVPDHKDGKIAILGLAYKGNIDDARESPAIDIVARLRQQSNYEVVTYDPYVPTSDVSQLDEALSGSDLAVILCDHDVFKEIPTESIKEMNQAVVFDTKNILTNISSFEQAYSLGKLPVTK
ncbi:MULTISPECIES: nucleotide sugar dehydrogenase [unclassified Enterococcus]|uniref:nucleotide sugar dehydrogenase n=1 Tax=unclassified Enterococcus TaxID=2608891 RepID=UPI001A9B3A1F|nr:nucleotide sugar dehydrogenase [Enterococcus sp. DIV1271a]MBO1298684.1 nucleotide sugar dehydrogenase [Enterococcus sp. DIV1271a]